MSTPSQHAVNAAHTIVNTPLPTMSHFLSTIECDRAREAKLAAIIQEHAIAPALAEKDAAIRELVDSLHDITRFNPDFDMLEKARNLIAKHKGA